MIIWKWLLAQTILDGYPLKENLIAFNETHILNDDDARKLKRCCQWSPCIMWVHQSIVRWIAINTFFVKNLVVETRILELILWRLQSIWFRYSKKVAYERRQRTMKVYHYSRCRHLWNCLILDHWSFKVDIHVVQIR
jgi:hypothetical protein